MMRIDVDGWQIRSFRTQDAEALARYANNRNVSRNLRDEFPYPYTLAHAETWISFAAQQFTESDFAIASATELIGGIGLRIQRDVHRRSAEVGYWLGEPFWGRGIATAALRAFTEYAFSQFDLLRLYGYVYEWNPASARVMEKAGYVCEGRLRQSCHERRAGHRPVPLRDYPITSGRTPAPDRAEVKSQCVPAVATVAGWSGILLTWSLGVSHQAAACADGLLPSDADGEVHSTFGSPAPSRVYSPPVSVRWPAPDWPPF